MTKTTKTIYNLAENPYITVSGSLASIIALCWLYYDKIIQSNEGFSSVYIFATTFIIFVLANTYSLRVRRENSAFRSLAKHLHKINHDYRDVLYQAFYEENPETDQDKILALEEKTVRSVCQRIERVFSNLIGKDCVVTVKLITEDDKGKRSCSTYVRSEENCERDSEDPYNFEIGTGKNTAFDTALSLNPSTGCSRFYSPDLTIDHSSNKYNNQRGHWDRHYRSTIVVPIRALNSKKKGTREASDDIGFLCLDTLSKNRLNDDFHVQYLAAFADQMYNFFSLMRGKYKIVTATGE